MSRNEARQLDGAEPTARLAPNFGENTRSNVLQYRPRLREPKVDAAPVSKEQWVVVCYGGHEFVSTCEMAECFLGKARLAIESHSSELVPLLHAGGLELLFIAENTPFRVGSAFEYRPYPDGR